MKQFVFEMRPGEHWWGGSTFYGTQNPFTRESRYHCDFRIQAYNQTMPLFLSDKGRYVWSEDPFEIDIADGKMHFTFDDTSDVTLVEAGSTLKEAYEAAMHAHFPFSGTKLCDTFFRVAQYNSWMEFHCHQSQEGILQYAHGIVDHGFTPGIIMIDEGWQVNYGEWEFNRAKFPDPKAMCDELHALGFKLMLWVVPYVNCAGDAFLQVSSPWENPENINRFMRVKSNDKFEGRDSQIAIIHWWGGYSAVLDFTNPVDCAFMEDQLRHLMDAYGVDGFKFDGGQLDGYAFTNIVNGELVTDKTPAELNIAWNEFGTRFEIHEYKDTWKGGGKASIQRICDKKHSWYDWGLNTLIPCSLVQNLIGHPFTCPDMIGGGEGYEWQDPVDDELFVRTAEVSAFFPMMQFSRAPWRVLHSEEALRLTIDAAKIHDRYADELIALVRKAEKDGDPIMRTLEFDFPGEGLTEVTDEFLWGTSLLVAPVVEQGAVTRKVKLPRGTGKKPITWVWEGEAPIPAGTAFEGGQEITVDAPLGCIPRFRRA